MAKNGKLKTEHRLTTLETNYESLEDKIDELKDNHITHLIEDVKNLAKSISAIDLKLAYWSGGIVVAIWVLERFI